MDLSIVIPAKNESNFIKKSIPALWASINKSKFIAEIILIDNGSDDDTIEIACFLGCKVLTSTQASIAGLRNYGAKVAKGTYLAFVDADCVVHEDWVSICIENLKQEKIGATGTRAVPSIEKATWVSWAWFRLAAGSTKRQDDAPWLGTSNLMLRKRVFTKLGGFNEYLITAEDFDFTSRLKGTHKIRLEKRIDTIHHREPTTIKELFMKEMWRGSSSLACYIRNGFEFTELASVAIPLFVNIFIGVFFISFFTNILLLPISLMPLIIFPLILMLKKGAPFIPYLQGAQTYLIAFTFIMARSIALDREIVRLLFRNYRLNFRGSN